jgi:iron uptake system component EfeO
LPRLAPPPIRFFQTVAAVVLAGYLVAACGGSTATPGTATTRPASSAPAGALTLEAKEYAFTPASLTAPAGAITFSVTNAGTENHEFEVFAGEQSLGKIDAFPRDSTRDLSVTLQAGDYTFACKLNGHDILGMKGTLTVTGS